MFVTKTPPAEGKITKSGVYDIPIERYHTQCCDGPSTSSSGLRTILMQSPAHFWLESDLNPRRVEPKDKPAFAIGRGAHHLLLGEEKFGKHFVMRPDEKPDGSGEKWNTNAKVCRAWLAEQELKRLTVLTANDFDIIKGMAGLQPWQVGMTNCGLRNTPIVQAGILNGHIEKSLIWKDEETGIWLKARPDAIPTDGGDGSDLKTIAGYEDRDLGRSIQDRGYHVQGALIGLGFREVLGIELQTFTLVFVDKTPPHPVAVKTITPEDLALGQKQIRAALRIFARCLETGTWPGPTARQQDAQYLPLPVWGRERFQNQLLEIEQDFAA